MPIKDLSLPLRRGLPLGMGKKLTLGLGVKTARETLKYKIGELGLGELEGSGPVVIAIGDFSRRSLKIAYQLVAGMSANTSCG